MPYSVTVSADHFLYFDKKGSFCMQAKKISSKLYHMLFNLVCEQYFLSVALWANNFNFYCSIVFGYAFTLNTHLRFSIHQFIELGSLTDISSCSYETLLFRASCPFTLVLLQSSPNWELMKIYKALTTNLRFRYHELEAAINSKEVSYQTLIFFK